jgi:methenyltetrahydromethanopterin cyclohydrolase
MTRKDYIQTANILKSFVDEIPQTTYEDLVDTFAEWFKADNENFDFARFEKACGIDEIGLVNVN